MFILCDVHASDWLLWLAAVVAKSQMNEIDRDREERARPQTDRILQRY